MSTPLVDDIGGTNLPPSPVWPTVLILLIAFLARIVQRPRHRIAMIRTAFEMGRHIGRAERLATREPGVSRDHQLVP